MEALRTQTVTFLFTDIEGSTLLWESQPEAMRAALQRHHALLHAALEAHHGHVFNIAGDAFCVAFATANDALSAALDAQRALHAEAWGATPIRVRMGLHTGSVELEGNDYRSGPTLNRVARVMALAHGGQILASQATAELVRRQRPAGVTLRDLGEHRLKGLPEPERIFQVVAPDLPDAFPSLKSAGQTANNLPLQLTSFIGREPEIAEVKHWLATTRLVTLTGAGGSGKTRLSLQVASEVRDEYADGAWLVEFAPLADPAFVPNTVASALKLPEQPGRALLETLSDYLRDKHLLLILDNCEHLVEACARLADALLHAAPRLTILASSREALNIGGEVAWRVPSLEVPTADGGRQTADGHQLSATSHQPSDMLAYPAIRLFVERATYAHASFRLTPSNAPVVAQICRQLDGMPLAIELAAARVKSLSVEQIATRLDDRFRLLTTGSRTAVPRQQTLRAAIDWSYELLSEPERVLLRRLSVFAGGWTLEAAEAVCADDVGADGRPPLLATDVLDLLTRLVEKSLVVAEEQDRQTRYRMLETIRQYGHEKLLQSGEKALIRKRHLTFFTILAQAAWRELFREKQQQWLHHLDAELDNLRAAIEWSRESGSVEMGLELATRSQTFWYMRGYWSEMRQRLLDLLSDSEAGVKSASRSTAFMLIGWYTFLLGETTASFPNFERAITLARELDAQGAEELSMALGYYGFVMSNRELMKAQILVEESLSVAREIDFAFMIANALNFLGVISTKRGDYVNARRQLEESMTLCRTTGNHWYLGHPLFNLGETWYLQGATVEAESMFDQALVIYREMGDRRHIAMTLHRLGNLSRLQSNYARADKCYAESVAIWQQLGNKRQTASLLGEQARAARLGGDYPQASSLLRESLQIWADLWQENAIVESLVFTAILTAQTMPAHAARLLGATEALRESHQLSISEHLKTEHDKIISALEARIGKEGFSRARAEGRALTLDQAIGEALRTDAPVEPIIPATHGPDDLSPREREVLSLVAAGLSDAQVAEKLVLSPRTINSHLTTIYRKLGVNSRAAATRYALDHKLV